MSFKLVMIGLFLFLLLCGGLYLYLNKSGEDISYGGVTLKYEDYKSAQEIFKDELGFVTCNLKSGNCIIFKNLNNG